MIRVHLIEGSPAGEAAEGTPTPAVDPDWKTLDELARTALRLARRLREQQDAGERAADPAGTDVTGVDMTEADAAGMDLTATAVTTADLAETGQGAHGPAAEVPTARDNPDK